MNNAILTLLIYKHNHMWVFDDDACGLVKEPFVAGIDKMIDHYVSSFKNPDSGFNAIFSDQPFPGYEIHLSQTREEFNGAWYSDENTNMNGWLCPALRHYFPEPPEHIYAKFIELP